MLKAGIVYFIYRKCYGYHIRCKQCNSRNKQLKQKVNNNYNRNKAQIKRTIKTLQNNFIL